MFTNFASALQICSNGKIQLNYEWSIWWPQKFGVYRWLSNMAIIAPFWATTDEYVAFKANHSKVYYQVYKQNDENAVNANYILNMASKHVRLYEKSGSFDNFNATWVIVVTWLNLCPFVEYYYGDSEIPGLNCRWVSSPNQLGNSEY